MTNGTARAEEIRSIRPRTQRCKHFRHSDFNPQSLADDDVQAILQDREGAPAWIGWMSEAGTLHISGMILSLYHHLDRGAKYPAVLLETGINVPRVDPWQMAEMPVLLRIEYERDWRNRETGAKASGRRVFVLAGTIRSA